MVSALKSDIKDKPFKGENELMRIIVGANLHFALLRRPNRTLNREEKVQYCPQ